MPRVLIVEDSSGKLAAVRELVTLASPDAVIVEAPTVVEAERQISAGGWDLVVLDISMDIAPSKLGPRSRGQANIGGLAIAQKMFLLEKEAPTIILTAYDSFTTSAMGATAREIVGFEEVQRRSSELLGNHLIACLQYNSESWREQMSEAIMKEFAK